MASRVSRLGFSVCLLAGIPANLPAETVQFTTPTAESESQDGVVAFQWERSADSRDFELQQSSSRAFDDVKTRYQGPDRGSVITGLPEGEFFFRVRDANSPQWSQPVKVEVRYMNMSLVWALMGVGVVVFFATVSAILRGHFNREATS